MIRKVNKLLVIVIIAVASIIEVGCIQSKNDNFKTGGSEQSMESTVDEGEISITNKSDNNFYRRGGRNRARRSC